MVTLLVATTGGHLTDLVALAPRFVGVEERLWVTFDTPQSRSLLAGEEVIYVKPVNARDPMGVLKNLPAAVRVLSRRRVERVISTGSGVALSFLPYAALRGIPVHYVECSARTDGPSVTGRLLRMLPRVRLYTQWRTWASNRWLYRGSVFEGFHAEPAAASPAVQRIVVTLGTTSFSFRHLVERVRQVVPNDADVLWQTGATRVEGLDIDARPVVGPEELKQAMVEADVIIGHAGCGTALDALLAGKSPILVPRDPARGEFPVGDTHQTQIAKTLESIGVALHRDADNLGPSDLAAAQSRRIVHSAKQSPFVLVEPSTVTS